MYRNITIVGVGLIGGSIGLAARRAFPGIEITGVDAPAVLADAIRLGAIDQGAVSVQAGWSGADLVILARTVEMILQDLGNLPKSAPGPAVVIDVGSTKGEICRTAWSIRSRQWRFVGGHPMAGSEKRGVENARADLFRGRPFLLCPEPGLPEPDRVDLEKFLGGMGARCRILEPGVHDFIVSAVSHLPQLVVLALASVLAGVSGKQSDLAGFSGPALREMLRIAASDFAVWQGICATNGAEIRERMTEMIETLEELRDRFDTPALESVFRNGNLLAGMWRDEEDGKGEAD